MTTGSEAWVGGEVVAPGGSVGRVRRFRWALGVFAGTLVVVVLVAVAVLELPENETKPTHQVINAPMWSMPHQLADEFVGVTVNSPTGAMPGFGVGSVRLWDSETRWQQVEPVPDRHRWTTLDNLVDGAVRAGLPVVYVFGGTPRWASPHGPPTTYPDGSRAAPPADLAEWDDFVADVVDRYRGRIGAYELWDMANHEQFFTGTPEVLVEMVRRAATVIRAADPAATVVCPSMGQLAQADYRDYLERFGALGGYDHCDVAAVKLYPARATDPPEMMVAVAEQITRSLHHTAGHAKVWSTGTDFDVPLQPPVDPERAADLAARFFLTGVYLRYDRMYFYNWGGGRVPIVLQPDGGRATRAAHAVAGVRGWLAGAEVRSCREGAQAGLPANVWMCAFARDGKPFEIWWTHEGAATLPAPTGRSVVERLDGDTYRLGEELTVTGSPLRVR